MQRRALTWLALAMLIAQPAAAITHELTGFGTVPFGSSVEAAKKVYPKMEVVTGNLGATAFPSEHLQRFVVRGVGVNELKKSTDVELRFWKDKLWAYIVYYGADSEPVVIEKLTTRFGPPNGTNPAKPSWQGDKTLTFVETSQDWYSVTDDAISKDAQAWFFEKLKGSQPAGGPAPLTPTPAGAKPAAAATPEKK